MSLRESFLSAFCFYASSFSCFELFVLFDVLSRSCICFAILFTSPRMDDFYPQLNHSYTRIIIMKDLIMQAVLK